MNKDNEILGFFVSEQALFADATDIEENKSELQGIEFRSYIWQEKGISNSLRQLQYKYYGEDLKLILFQFYINPIPYELHSLKEIENYIKSEKSIGIPIVITDNNFFCLSEKNRYIYLIKVILDKINLLEKVINKNKLDTNLKHLKSDIKNLKIFPKSLTGNDTD